jgi:nucleoside-diphosphate-sugar epimerase
MALLAARAGVRRFVHVSSAAVLGRGPLREGLSARPFSAYSCSKWLGEAALEECADGSASMQAVCYRPTSVQGPGRPVTRQLVNIARGPFSSVAGEGTRPTPQVLVQNVAAAIRLLVESPEVPEAPVLHPWEGMTTGGLLTMLSGGRSPRSVPDWVASSLVHAAALSPSPRTRSMSRRLEVLWFGQEHGPSTLERLGYVPELDAEAWADLARQVLAGDEPRRMERQLR